MSKKLLLHICCAPDATIPWPELIAEGYKTVGFFYGSNIHPQEEYERRLEALNILQKSVAGKVILPKYDTEQWLTEAEKFAKEPEGGKRCEVCFRLQLEAAARYAAENGYNAFCTTLTISPHKNVALINAIGAELGKKYKIEWIEKIWRKQNGFKRSVEESKRLGLYRQNYCGCVFSVRKEEAENEE